jgi:hypothetical protein
MGTIASLWRYDAAARYALQSPNLRRPTILRYASCTAVFPISQGWSGYPSIAALSILGIDVIGHNLPQPPYGHTGNRHTLCDQLARSKLTRLAEHC